MLKRRWLFGAVAGALLSGLAPHGQAPLALAPAAASERPALPARAAVQGLNAEQQRVRARSLAEVKTNLEGLMARYLLRVTAQRDADGRIFVPGTSDLKQAMARGPLLLDADIARELFPEYSASNRSRSFYSNAVHEAAGYVIDALWLRALALPSPPTANAVLMTGGGTASGKSTALASNPAVLAMMHRVAIVRDGTLTHLNRVAANVRQARAAGRAVEVLYVYAPIEVAVARVVDRGMRQGRGVPAAVVANSHWTSRQTVLQLSDRFRDDPKVQFQVLISGDAAQPSTELLPIEALRQRRLLDDLRFADQDAFNRFVEDLVRLELRRRFLDAHPADPSPQLRKTLSPRSER